MSVTISNVSDPLPISVTKLLTDKLYEKRKTAALDVEKIIRDFLTSNNHSEISKIVKFLSNNYVLSQNQNNKKGGLIGLAASAIALGKEAHKYRSDLVPSVLSCFSDSDSRVRYYACEALYNIVKVLKSSVLIYFNEIFDGLCKLSCDVDSNVRNGAELLDRLLKDTVLENTNNNEKFDLVVFIQLLRERIYVKNSYVRQFLVSWLKVLDSEPNLTIVYHISELLDGLFQILDDSNQEIKKMCESLLGDLLKEIIKQPTDKIKFEEMINIVLIHCGNTNDDLIQLTAMLWLKELCLIKSDYCLVYMPGILFAILPCLSYGDDGSKKSIRELARQINSHLWSLIDKIDEQQSNQEAISLIKVIESLLKYLNVSSADNSSTTTTGVPSLSSSLESLKWLGHLVNKQGNRMMTHIDEFFQVLISLLSSPSKEIVELDLQILANISINKYLRELTTTTTTTNENTPIINSQLINNYNLYFNKFMQQLVDLFHTDINIRYDKATIIIKELCKLLNSEDLFVMFSDILLNENDTEFALEMVDILNSILLTSNELFELRSSLKDFNTERSYKLFICLYKTWSYNPIATVSLCLLSQNYEHAFSIINLLGNIEVNLSILTAIDKLVQLIESPIFTYLRLDLLNYKKNEHLLRALYGLLMLIPQTDAFLTLKQRLDCVPNFYNKVKYDYDLANEKRTTTTTTTNNSNIDFDELLNHFIKVQERQKTLKKTTK